MIRRVCIYLFSLEMASTAASPDEFDDHLLNDSGEMELGTEAADYTPAGFSDADLEAAERESLIDEVEGVVRKVSVLEHLGSSCV